MSGLLKWFKSTESQPSTSAGATDSLASSSQSTWWSCTSFKWFWWFPESSSESTGDLTSNSSSSKTVGTKPNQPQLHFPKRTCVWLFCNMVSPLSMVALFTIGLSTLFLLCHCSSTILRKLTNNLAGRQFAIMVDETTDISNTEQLCVLSSVCWWPTRKPWRVHWTT